MDIVLPPFFYYGAEVEGGKLDDTNQLKKNLEGGGWPLFSLSRDDLFSGSVKVKRLGLSTR